MKYIILSLAIVLGSCGPEAQMWQRQYVIENSSSVSIELQFFRGGGIGNFGMRQLPNGQRFGGVQLDRSGGPWSELTSEELLDRPRASFQADSVRVVFNGQKLMVYTISSIPLTFSPSERNLLRDSDYTEIGGDKFLFTIDQSDFENAQDCNGSCD